MKSAYYVARQVLNSNLQEESLVGDVRTLLWKKMWHLNILENVRIFAWRICMNAIPTMMNLNKRGVQANTICPIYKKEVEIVEHAILKCDLAKVV